MIINLSPDGSTYVRIMTARQLWVRYNANNSSTTSATEELACDQIDFGICRSRVLLVSQLNPCFRVITQLGISVQTTSASFGGGLPYVGGTARQPSFAAFSLLRWWGL